MESTISGDGCLQSFKTQQSPTVWNTGVWNQNQYGIRHGVRDFGFTIMVTQKISGNLDVVEIIEFTKKSSGTWYTTANNY